MREFEQLPDGVKFLNKHLQQVLASWLGLAGNGSDDQLAGVPLRQTSVNDDTLYAVDARNRGTDGLHYRATHSSGSPELFAVRDEGVFVSVAGGAATQPFVLPGMVVMWHGLSSAIPDGWALCDGTNGTPDLRDRFVIGAGSTYALNATGGSATFNAEHTHIQNEHDHEHTHDFNHKHDHEHDHATNIDHDHGTVQSEPASTGGNNDEEGDAISGNDLTYSLIGHEHDVDIDPLDVDDRISDGPNNSVWTMDNDAPGQSSGSTLTEVDATGRVAVNQNAGSTTQSVLNPYYGLFFIKRIAA